MWILESVNSHNEYTITHKWNARENMVDRVMRKYKEGKYERFKKANVIFCTPFRGKRLPRKPAAVLQITVLVER